MTDRVTLYKDASGEWRWRRQSENGRIVATSGEGYKNLADAEAIAKGVNSDDVVIEREDS